MATQSDDPDCHLEVAGRRGHWHELQHWCGGRWRSRCRSQRCCGSCSRSSARCRCSQQWRDASGAAVNRPQCSRVGGPSDCTRSSPGSCCASPGQESTDNAQPVGGYPNSMQFMLESRAGALSATCAYVYRKLPTGTAGRRGKPGSSLCCCRSRGRQRAAIGVWVSDLEHGRAADVAESGAPMAKW